MKKNDFIHDFTDCKKGTYKYCWQIHADFFYLWDKSMASDGQFTINCDIDKKATSIICILQLKGYVELECDRTLKKFEYPIHTTQHIQFKLGNHYEDLSDDVTIIPEHSQIVDFSQIIWDYIVINIPLKKIHPDFLDFDNTLDTTSNEIWVYTTGNEAELESDKEISLPDPRWEALKKLKDTF